MWPTKLVKVLYPNINYFYKKVDSYNYLSVLKPQDSTTFSTNEQVQFQFEYIRQFYKVCQENSGSTFFHDACSKHACEIISSFIIHKFD